MASTQGTSNDGRPKRKRLAKACDACHKSKRRCDGMSPCANCFYASKACTYTDNTGKPVPAPRAMPEQPPQLSQQHQSQSQKQPYYHPVMTKRHRHDGPSNHSQSQHSQPVDPRVRVPMDLDAGLIRELVNLFFTHCHPALAMLHKPSFTNALSLNQIPPYLLFAICSLSARFSKQPSLHETPDRFSGRVFADEAERLMFEDQDAVGRLIVQPCLQAAQALTILSIFEILSTTHKPDVDGSQPSNSSKGKEPEKQGVDQWARGERYRDLSLHIVQALGAHLPDPPCPTPVPGPAYIESSIEREGIRRVFWYIYMVDLLRGTYYRWEATKKGGAGSGYAGNGVSLENIQIQGADPNTFSFNGTTAPPRQAAPNYSTTTSLANALGLHEGVMGFSEVELKLRLPVDETSFELGTIHESLPEYLYLPPICTPYASEFGHVIRVMTIHQKVEQCLGDVAKIDRQRLSASPPIDHASSSRPSNSHHHSNPADPHHHSSRPPSNFSFPPPPPLDYRQNQRRLAATHRLFECERVLNEWAESLPQQLKFTETNLHVQKSMFETSSNTSAWCWACMHTIFASCSLALAVGFRGIKVDNQRRTEPADARKPGEQSQDRKDLTWAVERLHIVLDLMGERAKFSMILGAVIWPLMRYVHQDDAQMKAWDDLYEDYTGVRMTDLTGGKWEEEPILGPNGADVPPLVKPSQSPTHPYPPGSVPLTISTLGAPPASNGPRHFSADANIGIAPSLVSNLPNSQQIHPSPSQATSHKTPLPSLKSSGLLEWQGSKVHVSVPPPPPQSTQSTSGPPLPPSSTVTTSEPGSSQTYNQTPSTPTESNHGRTGLSWLMNG
ncbi:hypothetical protein PQX77_009829 [Marasmius sp. AFHP31]|nr:hypothetical protein PQX77_009829 [Marasmius sp. AFHP31]